MKICTEIDFYILINIRRSAPKFGANWQSEQSHMSGHENLDSRYNFIVCVGSSQRSSCMCMFMHSDCNNTDQAKSN